MGSTPTIEDAESTANTTQPNPPTRKRRWGRRFGYGLLALTLLLIAGLTAGVFWLDSRAGHQTLIRLASDQAADQGYELTIDGVEGSLFGTLTIDRVALTKVDQALFIGEALRFSWQPRALLSREIQIDALTAGQLAITIPPAEPPVEEPSQSIGERLESAQAAINSLNPPVGITITELAIAELAITNERMAEPVRLALESTLDWPRLYGETRALTLKASRLNGAGEADIALGYDAEAESLDLNATISVPDAQAMASLTGLDHPLNITLSGQGSINNWQGRLAGGLADLATVDADITLSREGQAIRLVSAPVVQWTGQRPAALNEIMAQDIALSIEAQFTDNNVEITNFSAASGALDAQLTGTLVIDDLAASAMVFDATLTGTDTGYGVVPDLQLGDVSIGASLSPRAERNALKFTIAGDGVAQGDYAVDVVTLDVSADSLAPLLDGEDLSLIWALTLQGIVTENQALEPILIELGSSQTLGGKIDIGGDFKRLGVALEPWSLFGGELVARAVMAEGALAEAALDIRDLPLGNILALTGGNDGAAPIDGIVDARVRAVPEGDNLGLNARLAINEAQYQDARLLTLLGENPTVTATAGDIDGPIAVALTGNALTASATINGATAARQEVAYDLAITNANTLHEALDGNLALSGTVRRNGAMIDITSALEPLTLAGKRLMAESVTARLSLTESQAQDVALDAQYASLPINLAINSLGWGDGIALEQAVLTLADGGARTVLEGRVEADGALNFTVSGSVQNADIVQLIAPDSMLGLRAAWAMDIAGTTTVPRVNGAITELMISQGTRRFERGRLDLTATPDEAGDVALSVALDGQLVEPASRKPVRLNVDAVRSASGALAIADLRLDYGDLPIRLVAPTTLTQGPNNIRLGDTRLSIGGQELSLSGQYGAARVAADLRADGWALEPLMTALDLPEIAGQLDLVLALNATRQAVDLESSLSLSSVTMEAAQQAGLPVYDLTADLGWDGRRLSINANGQDREGQAPMRVDMSLPLRAERSDAAALSGATMPPRAELSGTITGTVDMALANQIVEAAGHRLAGALLIDLALAGTVQNPGLSGAVTMNDATYLNLLHGVAFDDIDVRMAGSLDGLVVEQLRAVAVNGGTIEGQGSIRFGEDAPLDLQLAFNDAQMIQSDLADLILDGNLGVVGRLPEHDVSGELTITEAEIRIPRRLPQSVATLEVEEERGRATDDEAVPADPITTNLDIRVNAPDRIFVRGLGLDMTLGGGITVEGTAADPLISGGFDLVQGRLDVAGQTWNFNRGGLAFNAQGSPELDVAASRDVGDITAIIAVEGPVSGPAISLTSEPPMAQGEIASRILFGEGMGGITAVQAVQATELLATLQGNSGRGVLGTARETLGIDQLSVDQTADGGASVSAGTYVSDGVFIGVNQGVGDVGSEVEIEVDITDTIKFEGTTGNRNNSRVGISVEWDY